MYSEVYKNAKIYLNQQTQLWTKLNVYKYYISRTPILKKKNHTILNTKNILENTIILF